jgi:predicted enzyme related to lactoylglutathione lyase
MIQDIAFIAYAVNDVPKSVAFYRDVVGLTPGKAFNEGYVEFDVGSTAFAVDSEPAGYAPGTCSGVAFEVDDVNAVRERLAAHGAVVSDVYEFPVCWICFAQDPDGNRFAIHRRKHDA